MALIIKDRVLETCNSPGTGSVTLLGAPAGYQTFNAAIGTGNTCYYTIADQTGSNWEVGVGTFTAPATLARTTVLASSTGSLVNFSTGTQNVFETYPASKAVTTDTFATQLSTQLATPPAIGGTTPNAITATSLTATGTTTLATSLTGIIKTTSGVVSTATPSTDYAPATTGTSAQLLANNGTGGFSNVTVGTGLTLSAGTLSNSSTSPIPAGTVTNFFQAAAPTGWTQCTTHNNKAIRIVSGTGGGTGGSVAFTTAFASQTPSGTVSNTFSVAATTLSTAQMPSHNHQGSLTAYSGGSGGCTGMRLTFQNNYNGAFATQSTSTANGNYVSVAANGGGGSHTHTFSGSATFAGTAINLAVQYVDNIIATKN